MATEVPSCSQNAGQTSIIKFMEKCNDDQTVDVNQLFVEWSNLLETLEISCDIRSNMDDWFMEVYNDRRAVQKMEEEDLTNMMADKESMINNNFINKMSEKIEQADFPTKMKLQQGLKSIQEKFKQFEWVKRAIKCVKEECRLIMKYNKESVDDGRVEKDRQFEEKLHECVERIKTEIPKKHEDLDQEFNNISQLDTKLTNEKTLLQDLQHVAAMEAPERKNSARRQADVSEGRDKLASRIKQNEMVRQQMLSSISTKMMDLLNYYKETILCMRKVALELQTEICSWKREFAYDYAQIAANPDLDRIAPWIGKAGSLLQSLGKCLMQTREFFNRFNFDWNTTGQLLEIEVMQITQDFFQSSFVVVEQEDFVIKIDKKNFPKTTVRLLAAEGENIEGIKVEAHFVFENHLQLLSDGSLDMKKVSAKQLATVGSQVSFQAQKKGKCKIATFPTLHFKERDFNREDSSSMVHEQKYRLVFETKFESHKYWTLSLPFVVTTGANQGCRALASIMWQCFSTDPYHVPIEKKEELPWCEVAKMVNQKILRLCPNKELSEENLSHLKNRLFGENNKLDDEMVSLKRFCFDKVYKTEKEQEEQCQFSFWKWFLANYNLLEKYLRDYWENGLIEGFISKEDCKRKFQQCRAHKNGLFILRFSDNNITDSQGVKNVFGHLTAAVSNIVQHTDGEKKKRVNHIDIGGHSTLKWKTLATILRETMDKHQQPVYKFLFPGTRSREEAFDIFCKQGPIVDGYEGPRDAFIVDMEHMVYALTLSTGKHRSPSLDSGFDPSSPCDAGNGGKRMRNMGEAHPTLIRMLSQQSDRVVDIGSPLSVPQPSPAMSVPSPATETRGRHDMTLLTNTPVPSPDCPSNFQLVECGPQANIPSFVAEMSEVSSASTFSDQIGSSSAHITHANSSHVVNGNTNGSSFLTNLNQNSREGSPEGEIIIINGDPDSIQTFMVPESECIVISSPSNGQNQQQFSCENQTANHMLSCASAANQSPAHFTTSNLMVGQFPCQADLSSAFASQMQRGNIDSEIQQIIERLQHLPPDTVDQIFSQVQSGASAANSPARPQMAMDNTPDDFQTSSSSGSNFPFNQADFMEAQQMDSGSIDPAVLQNFDENEQSF